MYMETDCFSSPPYSPIKADKDGCLRILIVGNSGAGKSTVADKLSSILNLPVMHLDAVYYKPKWRGIPENEFCRLVQSFMLENHKPGWIVDGDYDPVTDVVQRAATCILWLDPPFLLCFLRLITRCFLQLIGVVPPCSPGCNDSLVDLIFWEGNSVVWWNWTHHIPLKVAYTNAMQLPGDDQGGKWIRLSGGIGEVNAWLEQVQSSVKS